MVTRKASECLAISTESLSSEHIQCAAWTRPAEVVCVPDSVKPFPMTVKQTFVSLCQAIPNDS